MLYGRSFRNERWCGFDRRIKDFYELPVEIKQKAIDWVSAEAAKHSIEFVDGSPTAIYLALTAIDIAQEMYEAKNAGRSFSVDKAQAKFARRVKENKSVEVSLDKVKTWEQARNQALKNVGDLGNDSQPIIGSLDVSKGYGKIVGRKSADGKRGWRVETGL